VPEFSDHPTANSPRRLNDSGLGVRGRSHNPEPFSNDWDALCRAFERLDLREMGYRYARLRDMMEEAKRRAEITEEYDQLLRQEWENLLWERERRMRDPVERGQCAESEFL
jgi:hypothetical protein